MVGKGSVKPVVSNLGHMALEAVAAGVDRTGGSKCLFALVRTSRRGLGGWGRRGMARKALRLVIGWRRLGVAMGVVARHAAQGPAALSRSNGSIRASSPGKRVQSGAVREAGISRKCWLWHSPQALLISAGEARAGLAMAESENLIATAAR